jgi:hypothetical protein
MSSGWDVGGDGGERGRRHNHDASSKTKGAIPEPKVNIAQALNPLFVVHVIDIGASTTL